ncbi:ParB/RepB/Spo0J family partition protein [Sphingobium mellinum]|uniref:ParB/RepB/Spo0J family partition protein n=1 Tax=Sphingobium mellinum TaxID=1387166 RepID=UPI0030EE9698
MARPKKATAQGAPEETTAPASLRVAPMAIQPVPLGRLVRAPENVRHTDKAADVESLADDIAAHGLLQSLIGYVGDTDIDAAAVYIIGGGRRLQALQLLRERGSIDDGYEVSVLIRDQAEAIELSLSENLARRDMNPADEFAAFQELMRPGALSPADIAKRFGFSERYVKQRLRLAGLASEILDAMRRGQLTLDAAMAYAGTQDQKLQLRIFAAEEKKGSWGHGVQSIRSGITNAVMTTGDALFKFVGKAGYEKKGGRYEDDLFGDAENCSGRKLIDPDIIMGIATDRANFQIIHVQADAKRDHPATSDVILVPGLRLGKVPKAPKGYEKVERPYWRNDLPSLAKLREKASDAGIDIIGYAGIDHAGKLVLDEGFFVPGARLADVVPPQQHAARESEADREARLRAGAVRSVAAWMVARDHHKERTEGRLWWQSTRPHLGGLVEQDGLGDCHTVSLSILVTPAEIDARLEDAEKEYLLQEAEKAVRREAEERAKAEAAEALVARRAEVLAMDPAPVVIQVDGVAHFRWENGAYADAQPDTPEADEYECSFYDDLEELLENAQAIGLTWRSIEAWADNPHGDNVPEAEEEVA